MGESSKKKRTRTKSTLPKKVTAAARSILRKKAAAPVKKKRTATARKRTLRSVAVDLLSLEPALSPVQAESQQKSESSKYYSGPVIQRFMEEHRVELPAGYGDNRITLLVRDPYWVHAYWEIPGWKIEELKSLMGYDTFNASKKILRVYDVTDINFTGMNAHGSKDIHLTEESKNWYVNTGNPSRSWCIDIGFLTPQGKFYVAARSNIVSTPRDSMSETVDEEWMTIDWERMYAVSGGFGIGRSSGEIKEMLRKRLREELSSGMISSWSRDIHAETQKEKDFWLVVNTELIVYGATEPDAKLTVQGLPVKLRQDGTFTMRFALPDGRQEIPIVAVDKDGDQKRKITPVVEKRTK